VSDTVAERVVMVEPRVPRVRHGAIGATLLAIAVLGAVLQLAMLWAFHRLARP
jgi:hypothetical protein